jgi:hypothetical protein
LPHLRRKLTVRYLRVTWHHDYPEEPVELYSEIDDGSREVRKVEVFPDGRLGFASATESTESTRLGLAPVPTIAEIAADRQFSPREIPRAEFEQVWQRARSVVRTS